MEKQNEFLTKARELSREFLVVSTTECKSKEFEWGGRRRIVDFNMCCINGIRYVKGRDVCSMFTERRKTFIGHGLFEDTDFCYFIVDRGPAKMFVRADRLYQVRNELTSLCKGMYDTQKPIIPVAEAAMEAEVPDVKVDEKVFTRSQEAYQARIDLLNQSKKARCEQRYQEELEYEREQEKRRIEEGVKEERTLRDLVSQIEDMGWNVTLSLKGQ